MAFYIGLNIECFIPGAAATGLMPPFSLPVDPMNQSWRDYGTRVGIWRMIDLLDTYKLRASVLLNSDACEAYPQIMDAGIERNWAWLGHGLTNSRMWMEMDEAEETEKLDRIVRIFQEKFGHGPRGWLGPGFTETENSLPLMAERGFTYSLDWASDDQPYPLEVDDYRMISVPYSSEINDIPAFLLWHWTPEQFAQCVLDQFRLLWREANKRPGVVMALSLHPFLINTPFRHVHLERILDVICEHDDVWFPTTDEIADYYLKNYYDDAIKSIRDIR